MNAAGNPRGSGYERADADWYVEPVEATLALLAVERFVGAVHDPACGQGNIVKACKQRGLDAYGSDLHDRGFGATGINFLDHEHEADNIITNPPFSLAEEFLVRALQVARFKVAILCRLAWLEGRRRAALLQRAPLARVWVFANRINVPPGGLDLPAKGSAVAYAWFVFDHDHQGPASLGWVTT